MELLFLADSKVQNWNSILRKTKLIKLSGVCCNWSHQNLNFHRHNKNNSWVPPAVSVLYLAAVLAESNNFVIIELHQILWINKTIFDNRHANKRSNNVHQNEAISIKYKKNFYFSQEYSVSVNSTTLKMIQRSCVYQLYVSH